MQKRNSKKWKPWINRFKMNKDQLLKVVNKMIRMKENKIIKNV